MNNNTTHRSTTNNSTHKQSKNADINFNGAAILDDAGREVPITENMIQTACDQLVVDDYDLVCN